MMPISKSLRTFVGSEDYDLSRQFYKDLGFSEFILTENLIYFEVNDDLGFYLQRYYVKDWVDNIMMFLEVDDLDAWLTYLTELDLPTRYPQSRFPKAAQNFPQITNEEWGRVIYLIDPSGVLWHFGAFE